MDQYTEYIKNVILENVTNATDKELLQLIYGILMNSDNSIQEQSPSAS